MSNDTFSDTIFLSYPYPAFRRYPQYEQQAPLTFAMKFPTPAHAFWSIRKAAQAGGWRAVVLAVLSVGTLVFLLALVLPSQRRLAQLQAQSTQLHAKGPGATGLTGAVPAPGAGELDAFYGSFPAPQSAQDAMEAIYAAAQFHRILLEQGEYRRVPANGTRLMRYEMSFPVTGEYLAIRKFIAQVLEDNRTLALDSVALTRPTVQASTVEANLRFTLFLAAQ